MTISPAGAAGGGAGAADSQFRLCPQCHHIYPADAQFCARDRTQLVADERILAGKFLLLRKIGEGNMGAVYEAEQPQIGRTVAVKVLRPDPEVMLRFEREVQASGALNHANVVTIFDSGLTADGRGYIAMEYLEGESLASLLEREKVLPPARALELWIPVVRAMSAAHGKSIIHRDLKPDNVFIARRTGDDGTESVVKVLDFGIAKFQKRAPIAKGTTPGMIIGTMQYMSPEQLQGAEADPRADVYALGIILVEMLTGRLPWGDTKEIGYAQFALRLVMPAAPLQKLRPEQPFSIELQRLTEDMLAQDVSRRPASGAEIIQRLKSVPEARGVMIPQAAPSGSSDALKLAVPVPMPVREGGSSSGTVMVARSVLPGMPGMTGLGKLPPGLRRPVMLICAGLGVMALIAGVLWMVSERRTSAVPASSTPDLGTVKRAEQEVKPAHAEGEKGSDSGAAVQAPRASGNSLAHRPAHAAGAPLQVQFAFTDGKSVRLVCGSKTIAVPDCSASGVCKAVAAVLPGQRCVAEQGGTRRIITYSDIQKNPPDRKNLIHVLVRFQ